MAGRGGFAAQPDEENRVRLILRAGDFPLRFFGERAKEPRVLGGEGEKIVQRHGLDSELVRLRLGAFGMAVRAFRDLQMLKGASILQIGRADVAAADDSRFHG